MSLLTSQTHVISLHQKKVTEIFHQRNIHAGFYSNTNQITKSRNANNNNNNNKNDADEKEDEVSWFPAVNGRDPTVLDEWAQTSHHDFPNIIPDMGRERYHMPPDPKSGNTNSASTTNNTTTNNNLEKDNYLSPRDGDIIDISKLEMNKMNSTKSIVSKQVRL